MIKFFSNIYSLKQKIGRIFSIITIKDTSNPQGFFKMSLFESSIVSMDRWCRCRGFDGYFYCTKLFPTNLYKCGIIKEMKIIGGKRND